MKRKFTSFATLVLSCLMAAPALAESLSLTGLGDIVTAPEVGEYYVIQGNGQAGQISWLYDNNGTFAATEASEPATGPEGLKYVWTFETSNEGFAARNIATGRYIYIEGTTNGGSVKMQDSPAYFSIDVSGDEVGFVNASGRYIDMGYSGVGPVTWNGGVSGSRRLTIYVAVVEEIPDITAALARLNTCFGTYQDYLPDYGTTPFERGTGLFQYNCSDEDYNLFVENLELAEKILSETVSISDYTVEDIDAIIKNIEDGYAAIVASRVMPNGNYRVLSALEWTNTERIATGEYDDNGDPLYEDVTVHPTKAMYATLEGKAMWANIDETDCRYLWKMTHNTETGFVKMMNIATDGILATCSQSTQATLTADSQTELSLTFIGHTEDGKVILAMKPSTGGSYAFLHCNNHGGGSGRSSNIVGWTAEAGASQWILEPVSDEEVQELVDAYAPIKDHELLVSMFQKVIAETEAAIEQAKDDSYITERSAGLITSTSQFSSPCSDAEEGSLDNVLSDDASTFWHSDWHGGNVANHTHYFHVSFAEPIAGNIQCFVRRRNVMNDHITQLGVFGSNDESALESGTEEGWTEIGTFDLSKNASSSQTVYSNNVTLAEGYKYFRFYIDGTTTGRGYGHFATFQLYNITIDGNTQWSQLGDAATAIETALATAKAVDLDEMVDMTEYNALKDALDAFKALLVDPSALAEAIAANKNVTELIAIGENPGFWSADSETSSFASLLEEATAYLKGGVFTQEQTDAYVEAIKSGASDLFATANPVEPGKWYALWFDTEESYDYHNWNKDGAVNTTLGDLFGNYAAPANVEENNVVGFETLEEVTFGQAVRFINEDEVQQMDQVAFRFVAQGDTAFVIQHKSGLYLSGAARSQNLTLGLMPAIFNVRAVGYGKVVIEARDLKGQGYYDEPVYLHAQNAGHSLVTWNNDAVGSSSALFIEPIAEGDFDEGEDIQESFAMSVMPNGMTFMCYPAGFSVTNADIYAYQGAIPDGDDKAQYAFNKIEQAAPGQPVLLVVGNPEALELADPIPGEESELISITPVGTAFAPDPLTVGGAHGTYTYQWVDEGTVVVGGGDLRDFGYTLVLAEGKENTDCTRDVSAHKGYIVYGENILQNASVDDFDLVIEASRPTLTGDLNNDNKVDIADAVSILNIMAAGEYSPAADINGDEKVDIADFVSILNIMAGQ